MEEIFCKDCGEKLTDKGSLGIIKAEVKNESNRL